MFNPLRPDQMILAVGGVLRLAAGATGPLDPYQRSQALSASSVARFYAAELSATGGLLDWLRAELLPALESDGRPPAVRAHDELGSASDGAAAGAALARLLEDLRETAPHDDPLRRRVQALLGELAGREVEALARGTR